MRIVHLKKKYFSISCITLILFNTLSPPKNLMAQSLLFRSKGASKIDFKAFLKTDTPYMSFEDFYLRSRTLENSKTFHSFSASDLSNIFKHSLEKWETPQFSKESIPCRMNKQIKVSLCLREAQKAYLIGDFEKAEKYFQKLNRISLLKDWNLEERKALHYSFLRLAQITQDLKEQKKYILKAQNFFPTLFPDPSLFSPHFIKKYKTHSRKTTFWIPEEKIFHAYSAILINGKKYGEPFIQPIEVPENESFRMSLISNSSFPVSKIINAKKLKNLKLKEIPFVKGTCEKPMISPRLPQMAKALNKKIFVFFNPYCIQSLSQIEKQNFLPDEIKKQNINALWKQKEKRKNQKKSETYFRKNKKERIKFLSENEKENPSEFKNEYKKPLFFQNKENKTFSIHSHLSGQNKQIPRKKSLIKTNWFWLGIGSAILTSIVVSFSYENTKKPHTYPKRKKGF